MSVITFASPKGGVGKTTAALLLATELAVKGFKVTVLDADPEKWIVDWSKLPDKPENLEVVSDLTEDTIIEAIEEAQQHSQFVIIDLEGTASTMVVYAVSRSDFVLVPIQASTLDGKAAAKIVRFIRKQEKAFNTDIPFSVFLTRTKAAIKTRMQGQIQEQLKEARIPLMEVQLLEREAFRQLFSFGGSLNTLDPKRTYKVDDAIVNARAFAGEVLTRMKEAQAPSEEATAQENVA